MFIKVLSVVLCSFVLVVAPVAAERLAHFSRSGLTLTVERDKALIITLTVQGSPQISHTELSEPARIVIDLIGVSAQGNRAIPVQGGGVLSGVRIGAHPDKTRVVIDITEPSMPQYSFDESRDKTQTTVMIRFLAERTVATSITAPQTTPTAVSTPTPARTTQPSPSATATPRMMSTARQPIPSATPITKKRSLGEIIAEREAPEQPPQPTPSRAPAVATPTKSPTATRAPTVVPTAVTTPLTTPTPTALPTIKPTPVATVQATLSPAPPQPTSPALPAATPSAPVVEKILFTELQPENVPALQIKVSTAPQYKLIRKSDQEFLLTIQNCGVNGEALTLPYFAPQHYEGFKFVVASPRGQGTEITIKTDRNAKLAVFTKDGSIWIKATIVKLNE